jgi:hypothetical protein
MHIECRDIFRPSLVNEQSIELGVPLRWRGCIDNLANLAESVFCRGAPAEIRLALGRKASSQVGGLSSSVFSSETLSNRGEVAARGAGYFTRGRRPAAWLARRLVKKRRAASAFNAKRALNHAMPLTSLQLRSGAAAAL